MRRLAVSLSIVIGGCYMLRSSLISKPYAYRATMHQLNERKLYNEIRRHKGVVILLYQEQKKCKAMTELQKSFNQLARSGYYPRKAIHFMHINIATAQGKQFVQDNHLSVDRLPAVALFSDGLVLEDQHGPVQMSEAVNRNQLKDFIDTYLSIDIAQYVHEERAFKQYQDIIRDRAHVYYTPYFSRVANPWNDWWGWPYYGMAQGNYGGNMGVNFFASNY